MKPKTLALAALLIACSHTPPAGTPTPVGQRILTCGTQAVRDHGLELIPKVNDCLASVGDWEGCLLGLVVPAIGITTETIDCIVHSCGSSHAASARLNPNDAVGAMAAQRAREFLKKRGYTVMDPTL